MLDPRLLNEGFVVAIAIEAKPGEADRVAALLADLAVPSNAEPGMKAFLPYRSPSDPASFFIYELYRDEAAWAEHQATAHFKAAIPELLKLVARRERTPFVPYAPLCLPTPARPA
ncbi:Quinol monooxygenase YgiN [Tistlia consotensis]|uniref:Quinol monooxygenase YgiN n=1 Tax=Tistlia consotensis USBA 355 TaxID=560819 RepID=A0A1Y6BDU2_9PROT|nr:putative quinol monooxygenase [Tistlia consotensis]SMF02489.1 Quinol monooxygenase YgiN [Tistlia consotensis USBA 355]SNR52862.1 Quinol monooxygenase YgiN [Tistlia consotensis]